MLEKLLDRPKPESAIEQIHVFAHDLAYGVADGLWSPVFNVFYNLNSPHPVWRNSSDKSNWFKNYKSRKWIDICPNEQLLVSFGYLSSLDVEGSYVLTEKALNLLAVPLKSPDIFISYGHKQSSELALLIEARLKYVDREIGIFIDKEIPLGDRWHQHLEDKVKIAQYFVCLLGRYYVQDKIDGIVCIDTIQREPVQKEIRWVLEADIPIIFICHRAYTLPDEQGNLSDSTWELVQKLLEKQGIFVSDESAEQYETAINKLLNRLQYPTF